MQTIIAYPRSTLLATSFSINSALTTGGPTVVATAAELQALVSRNPLDAAIFDTMPYGRAILTFRFWALRLSNIVLTGSPTFRLYARAFTGHDAFELGSTMHLRSCNSPYPIMTDPVRGASWHSGATMLIERASTPDVAYTNTYAKIALSDDTPVKVDSDVLLNTAPMDRFLTFTIEATSTAGAAHTVDADVEMDVEVTLTLRDPA